MLSWCFLPKLAWRDSNTQREFGSKNTQWRRKLPKCRTALLRLILLSNFIFGLNTLHWNHLEQGCAMWQKSIPMLKLTCDYEREREADVWWLVVVGGVQHYFSTGQLPSNPSSRQHRAGSGGEAASIQSMSRWMWPCMAAPWAQSLITVLLSLQQTHQPFARICYPRGKRHFQQMLNPSPAAECGRKKRKPDPMFLSNHSRGL